jgi:hypothetical protein
MSEIKTKHTPGPWEVVKCSNDESSHVYSQPDKSEMYTTIAFTKKESDAKLIAAAPKLLKALKNLMQAIDDDTVDYSILEETRKIIFNAEQ